MYIKPKAVLLILFFIQASYGWSQSGRGAFKFLDQPASARLAALGSINVSSPASDASMLQGNPAFLQSQMKNQLSLGYTGYLADIAMSSIFYTWEHRRLGSWGAGLQYQGFGDFTETDPSGQVLGTFSVHDYVWSLSHATTLEPFTLAATFKMAFSGIADYKSLAGLFDLGGMYKHPEKELYFGLVLKNMGYQFKTFYKNQREYMPFDAQIGVTIKPEHMPVRFSLTAHHLHTFNILYQDSAQQNVLNVKQGHKTFGEQLASHFVAGGELILSKNFTATLGYNNLRRQELRLETKSGGAGLSIGGTFRIKAFELTFTRAYYHVAGASNGFTIVTNMARVLRKKAGA